MLSSAPIVDNDDDAAKDEDDADDDAAEVTPCVKYSVTIRLDAVVKLSTIFSAFMTDSLLISVQSSAFECRNAILSNTEITGRVGTDTYDDEDDTDEVDDPSGDGDNGNDDCVVFIVFCIDDSHESIAVISV